MSGGFSFPPPPPPPPKPAQSTSGQYGQGHQNNPGLQRGRGRGDVRGGLRGRGQTPGRGNSSSNNSNQNPGPYRSWQTSDLSDSPAASMPTYRSSNGTANLPPGAYVNPNQTPEQLGGQNVASPSRTAAGHKRKLDALRPQNENIKRPGPPTAPAIPSFGAPILPSNPTTLANAHAAKPKNATGKSGGRSLGLTPASNAAAITYSDSEDDGLDEEALYAELGDKLTFEHNGVVMSLKSQADLVAWKKERHKNWPTKARMEQKNEERRRIGEERKRLLSSASTLLPSAQTQKLKSKRQTSAGNEGASIADSNERAKRLDELRKKVLESESKNLEAQSRRHQVSSAPDFVETAKDTADELLDAAPTEETMSMDPSVGAEYEAGSVVAEERSTEPLAESPSDSTSESGSESDVPEEITSKPPSAHIAREEQPVCKYFAASGYCKFGDGCRFKHELSTKLRTARNQILREPGTSQQLSRSNAQNSTQRKGIFERLKEQEQQEEDRLALKVIKYLGKAGFFNDSSAVDEG